MQNVNVISDNGDNNKTLSLSSEAVSITEPLTKPEDEQTQKVSAAVSQNVSTLKRLYGSMPNITASITTNDDTTTIEAPTADEVQQVSAEPLQYFPEPIELENNSGPQMQYDIGLVNVAEMLPPTATVGEDEIRSPSVTSDLPVSAAETKHDGSDESDAKMSRGLAGLRPRLWCSMPNIHIHYTDKVFYKTAEIECIGQMTVSPDSLTDSITTAVTEPAEVTPVKIKRSSFWKRTKKFARRVFCCGAA